MTDATIGTGSAYPSRAHGMGFVFSVLFFYLEVCALFNVCLTSNMLKITPIHTGTRTDRQTHIVYAEIMYINHAYRVCVHDENAEHNMIIVLSQVQLGT